MAKLERINAGSEMDTIYQARKWVLIIISAVGFFVAGIDDLLLHHLLSAGGSACLGGNLILNATGALEEKGTGKYRVAQLLMWCGGVLSFAGFFQRLLSG